MSSNKEKALDVYNALKATRNRKDIIKEIVRIVGVSEAYASTLYATAKKSNRKATTRADFTANAGTSSTSRKSSVTKFDRKNLRNIRADLENAVKDVAEKYGIALDFGGGRFSDYRYSLKLTCLIGSDGSTDHAKINWNRHCRMFGLTPEDFGRTFTDRGTKFTICGIKPKGKTYPIIARNDRGTEYKFPLSVLGINSINAYF